MNNRIAVCLSLLTLGVCGSVHAAPLRFLVETCSEECSREEGELPVFTEVEGSNNTGYLYGQTSWRVQARTELGALHGYAHAESNPIAQTPANQLPPTVGGHAIAIVTDYISIAAPRPALVPVTLEVTLVGSCSGTDGTNFNGTERSTCAGSASLFFAGVGIGIGETGSKSTTRTLVFQPSDPGGPFELTYRLDVHGEATNGMFTGDFSHTAFFRVFTTAPGVSIVSQSGYDYASPVPVPAAAWLLLPMLGMLAPWVRRK